MHVRIPVKRLVGLGAVVVVAAGGWLFWHQLNQPASGTISEGAPLNAPTASISLRPRTETGTYASFTYPSGLQPEKPVKFYPPTLEQFTFSAHDLESWELAISVSTLPGGTLRNNNAYWSRKTNPTTYHESTLNVQGQPVVEMTDSSTAGFSKMVFMTHNSLVAVISLIGDDPQGTQPLQTAFNTVLNSWHWTP